MEIFLSPYELIKTGSGGVQRGTLVKILEGDHWGVADLCPHPDLGDCTWKSEVSAEGALYKRALHLAAADLKARKSGLSLLKDKKILNNLLITDYLKVDLNQKNFAGQTVKIKGDNRIDLLAGVLNGINQKLSVRVDFNSKLTAAEFEKFLGLLSSAALEKFEYIEDPAVLSGQWQEWSKKVPLASDWQKTQDPVAAKYRIIKPAREEIPADMEAVTLTSAMDHPVGVAHGLRLAQTFAKNVSGFLTLDLYEPTAFHRHFVTDSPWLNFAEPALADTGIGMSKELNVLEWIPLTRALL